MRTIIILILSASTMFAQTASQTSQQRLSDLQAKRAAELSAIQTETRIVLQNLAALRKQYTEDHPQVINLRAQLSRLRTLELTMDQTLLREGPATEAEKAAASQRIREIQQQMTTDRVAEEVQARLREMKEKQTAEASQTRVDKAQNALEAAQLAKTKAAEAEIEARLAQLRRDHPDIAPLTQKLDALRAQEREIKSQARNITPEDIARLPVLPVNPYGPLASPYSFTPIPLSPLDRWWRNNTTAQSLGLSTDQQQRMDDVLQQYRLKLVDVNGALQKEEIALEPLVGADKLDETKITGQIDRVAQARAELEKVNGRMLLQIRKQLTPEQWRKLNQTPAGGAR